MLVRYRKKPANLTFLENKDLGVSILAAVSIHHSPINAEFEKKIHKSIFNLCELFS